jgi:hypothetical protein
MVQRLARGPFKAEIRVRFPLALPIFQEFTPASASFSIPIGPIVGGDAMKFDWQRLNVEYARQFGIEAARNHR